LRDLEGLTPAWTSSGAKENTKTGRQAGAGYRDRVQEAVMGLVAVGRVIAKEVKRSSFNLSSNKFLCLRFV